MKLNDRAFFDLQTAIQLFRKAEHDFDRLDKEVNAYDLFNFLCALNHMRDWINKDPSIGQTVKDDAKLLKQNDSINLVRRLCNRAKHFELRKKKELGKTTHGRGYGVGRFGRGGYGVGEMYYTVEEKGQVLDILDVCGDAFEKWRTFLQGKNLI